MSYWKFAPYVTVAEKRARAEKKIRQLKKKKPDLAPVVIEGRSLARTWWGKSWNANLERYADYSSRIGRGRSYVRHLAVLDLRIDRGSAVALVQGSRSKPYRVEIKIKGLGKTNWKTLTAACGDKLDSLQDLLAGRFPRDLSHLFLQRGSGLFPSPKDIQFSCSCPDWAYMCKHVAAVLYGIGARLDEDPSLFFVLRQVNMDDLIARALSDTTEKYLQKAQESDPPVVAEADLGRVFGIDMDVAPEFGQMIPEAAPSPARAAKPSPQASPGKRSPAKKKGDDQTLILERLQRAKYGIDAAGLHAESGIDIVKIRSILYRAYHKGLIQKVARGIYTAGTPSPADRRAAVLAVIEASAGGIRTPRVAEETGMHPASVRPVLARLLKTGEIRRMSRGLYGPPVNRMRTKPGGATRAILAMIQTHPDGVAFAALKTQSGFEEKQLRNIVFRLVRSGKIRRAGRGIYAAVPKTK
ncbi:hypothetical protein DSCA_35100 [Desulfosarcina alkanivorans]|uniref:SWIM-type domain-containing protein n=1 Tax=Desulfosarcina alkanivorans TaxID=571177 RepID=A0A5K7YMU3_9BACT|nr:SWIM zinc finger family protein [Desulfosarcina alkanivorans]BBO69580.1 hypothetical protein DSCA_35100 [Desulfosarcina alkanivorans]